MPPLEPIEGKIVPYAAVDENEIAQPVRTLRDARIAYIPHAPP